MATKSSPKSLKALIARLEALRTEIEVLKDAVTVLDLNDREYLGGTLGRTMDQLKAASFVAEHTTKFGA